MTYFKRKAAIRIGAASVLLAAVSSLFAWYVSKENFEESIVSLAYEEAQRLIVHRDSLGTDMDGDAVAMQKIVTTLTGGLFDIAEIYNVAGIKIAEALTVEGERVEKEIPKHSFVQGSGSRYESHHLMSGEWVLRVFVPLQLVSPNTVSHELGYFEGIRIIPSWQQTQILHNSFVVSVLVTIAALSCGLIVYPIVVRLSTDNETKTLEVLDSHISMMEALGRAIAKRDSDTGVHNYRVAWIAAKIGEQVGLSSDKMQSLIAGSFLHDVGKIGISDSILLKPGKLTEQEFDIMRTHVIQGEEIVSGMGWLEGAHEVVAAHHEKWDGTGYPRGLKHQEIPLSARIFAVADVFDALSSKRPYKEAMSYDKVIDILQKDSGSHFDQHIMDLFIPISKEISTTLAGLTESEIQTLLKTSVREHFYL